MLLGASACGSSNNGGTAAKSTQAIKLTVWGPSEDQAKSDSWLPTMEKQFEKAHPEYKITWKNAVVSEGDAGTTVKQDPSAAADVYMFANDQLGTLLDAQQSARFPMTPRPRSRSRTTTPSSSPSPAPMARSTAFRSPATPTSCSTTSPSSL